LAGAGPADLKINITGFIADEKLETVAVLIDRQGKEVGHERTIAAQANVDARRTQGDPSD
jgi:hypothetical protein